MTGNVHASPAAAASDAPATVREIAARNTVGDRLRHAARNNGDRPAIQSAIGACTYAELDARVDHIAFIISRVAQGEPQRVGLLLDQGPLAVTSSLGVLRAGLMYVPLDVHDPPARLRRVLDDADPCALLTDGDRLELAESLAPDGCEVINLDRPLEEPPADWTSPRVDPDAPAYILYTSGTTGEPKGVIQTHQNLLHFVDRYTDTLGVTAADRMTLLYSLSFSAANMDLYGALTNGATLCLYDVKSRGVGGLDQWLRENDITILHTVPTLFRHLCRNMPGGATFDRIRAVDLGGEPVFSSDVALFKACFGPDAILINHLAATEASVIAQHVVSANADVPDGVLAAGRIAPGVDVSIQRADGTDAEPDETGEIVIRSRFLSPGYWRRPDLTRAAFGDEADDLDERTYRSGDLGRIGHDGLLYVAGRRDARVKIRGHSVAIGEVEAAIRSIARVRDGVVVATTDSQETKLAAYLVAPESNATEIRTQAAALLPPYMIPSEFIILDELPRTSTGKIDRNLLAGPDRPRPAEEPASEPPGSPLEIRVASIFSRVLNQNSVVRHSNFFELGGDSLMIVQLQTEVKRALECELPLADLLRDPTVAGVAGTVQRQQSRGRQIADASPLLVPLREGGAHPPLFLVHGALGQAFISPRFVAALGDDQPLYAIQAQGADGSLPPHRTVSEMASAYIDAVRHVQPRGPYLIGGICGGSIVAHEMACQLHRDGETAAPLLLFDPPRPPRGRNPLSRLIRIAKIQRELRAVGGPQQTRSSTKIARRLRARVDEGKVRLSDDTEASIDAGVRVTLNFRLALLRHRLGVWNGDACVLGSRERINAAWRTGRWSHHISGNVKLVEMATEHTEVLDPTAPDFAARLGECLDFMRAGLPANPLHRAIAADHSSNLDHPADTHKMTPTDAG